MPKKRKKVPSLNWGLESAAAREIIAIVLLAVSLLLLLAIFNIAGSFGSGLFLVVRLGVGMAGFLVPLGLILAAVALFQPERYQIKPSGVMGLAGFFIFLAGLLHTGIDPLKSLDAAQNGNGGGYIGYVIMLVLRPLLFTPAIVVVLLALILICVVMVVNAPLSTLVNGANGLVKRRGEVGDLKIREATGVSSTALPIKGTLRAERGESLREEALLQSTDTDWVAPPLDLLEATTTKADAGNIKENAAIIRETLSNFGIEVAMEGADVGPTVSQYTLKPSSGVKLNKITTLERDLSLALAAHPIRIEAPIPGKSLVGIEIPNKTAATVRLRDILTAPEAKEHKSNLTFVLGRDVSGTAMFADIARMPHLLIAGATGSGKSVMINTLLVSLLYRNSPSDLKLILVDPKRVELSPYNNIPHLLAPVIVEVDKTISALKWAVAEMERRYRIFAEDGRRNIVEYNAQQQAENMPYIVIVIDELADLMVVAAADVESLIVRLAQMARATGIHLVLATQRPSVDVITGLIKANVPTRIAFNVASQVDSRTILDQAGAEKLLGRGDMLYTSPETSKPKRVQGVFLSAKETEGVTAFLKAAREPQYNDEILAQPVRLGGGRGSDLDAPDDDMFMEAAETVIQAGKASASLLQRRLRVGYARAARLLDLLEERGVVGPPDGARPRDVLVSQIEDLGSGEDDGS